MKIETKKIERQRENLQSLTKGIEDLAALVGVRFVADDEKLQSYRELEIDQSSSQMRL